MAAERATLSQREIDALLSAGLEGLDLEEVDEVVARRAPRDVQRRVKAYDFRHPDKLSKEQLRGLQLIQQSVASSIAAILSGRLRLTVEARLGALERGIFEEYLGQIGLSAALGVLELPPLRGVALVSFGLDLAFAFVDRLLGGPGRMPFRMPDRELTDIELALLRHVVGDIARSLVEPWSRLQVVEPKVTDLVYGPQVMHPVPPSEFVLTAWYEIRFIEQTGGISLCFPLTLLEDVLPKLTGQSLFEGGHGRFAGEGERVRQEHLLPAEVSLRALLGRALVSADDLAELAPGDVIVLDTEVGEPLRILVGNVERFAGQPGTVGKRLGIKLLGTVDEDGFVRPFPAGGA